MRYPKALRVVLLIAGAAMLSGLCPARAMPVAIVASDHRIAPLIPVAGGCGPGAYRVGGVCRGSSGPVIYRYKNGVRTSNAAGCLTHRPRSFGQLLRFCR